MAKGRTGPDRKALARAQGACPRISERVLQLEEEMTSPPFLHGTNRANLMSAFCRQSARELMEAAVQLSNAAWFFEASAAGGSKLHEASVSIERGRVIANATTRRIRPPTPRSRRTRR